MAESRMVYVVMGTTGEYSDRDEWPVRAFFERAAAEALVLDASRRAREIQVERDDRYHAPRGANEYDPGMRMDYTGTRYFIYEVPLAD